MEIQTRSILFNKKEQTRNTTKKQKEKISKQIQIVFIGCGMCYKENSKAESDSKKRDAILNMSKQLLGKRYLSSKGRGSSPHVGLNGFQA